MAPRRPSPPDVQQTQGLAGRRVLAFGLLLVGALLSQRLPLPWQAVALAWELAALVAGVLALVPLSRLRRTGSIVLVAVGMALSALLLVSQAATLAFYPSAVELQECQAGALTVQGRSACQERFSDSVEDQVLRLLGAGG